MPDFNVGDTVERVGQNHHGGWAGMTIGDRATIAEVDGDHLRLNEYAGGHGVQHFKRVLICEYIPFPSRQRKHRA